MELESDFLSSFYGSVIHSIPIGALAVNTELVVATINPALERLLGSRPQEWVGFPLERTLAGVLEEERVRELTARLRVVLATSETITWELAVADKTVAFTASPLTGPADNVMGLLLLFEDITERKRAEDELRSSQEQLRELAVRLESIREEERARTAYQIQEEFGQVMAALKMSLRGLDKSLPKDQALHKRIDFISELIDGNIRMVRKMSEELRPSALDHLGIGVAIEWHAKDFQDRTGIRCEVTLDPEDLTLDTDRSTTLFRIFQAILTNVTRHAQATKVAVCLRANLGEVVLEVSDNGKGITQEQISDPSSLGLLGMRERVYPYGGKVDIRGVQGKGTTVTVRIPIDGQEKAR